MYVQPFDGSLTPNSLASPPAGSESSGTFYQGAAASPTGDNISRFAPPWPGESGMFSGYGQGSAGVSSIAGLFGPLMGMLQQLMQMLQSLMGYGCNAPYGPGGCPPYGNIGAPPGGNERFFQNASGSSDGDPHLSFNGARWNNMSSQPDLLNSDSFDGGFRISTQVTPPNAKGVTWNQSATVALNNGATTIGMTDSGQASITSYGQSLSIAPGQTMALGNGESVTYEENGSLRISAQNGSGGNIETTLTPEGKGVNVDVTAHDVDLGGTLVHGYEGGGPISEPPISTPPLLAPPPQPLY
jgi:hypothetical protein